LEENITSIFRVEEYAKQETPEAGSKLFPTGGNMFI
jgi:hypothetical protein